MNNKLAFIFPGQGSQYVGMDKINNTNTSILDFSNSLYNSAKEILGYNIKEIINSGPKEILNQTNNTQPAIFILSLIHAHILKTNNFIPTSVAGHSLGEFTALVSAEVISFEDALKIIKIRSEKMKEAGVKNPGTMAAIIGANDSQINEICSQKGIVVPANYNSDTQVVISGEIDAINDAILKAKDLGIRRAIPLNVSGAFHSPLMKSARIHLEKVINSIDFKNAKIPVYQNVNALPINDGNKIKDNLIQQLESPVRWNQTITNMSNDNYKDFIEVGPGKILFNLNKKIIPNLCSNYSENIIKELL